MCPLAELIVKKRLKQNRVLLPHKIQTALTHVCADTKLTAILVVSRCPDPIVHVVAGKLAKGEVIREPCVVRARRTCHRPHACCTNTPAQHIRPSASEHDIGQSMVDFDRQFSYTTYLDIDADTNGCIDLGKLLDDNACAGEGQAGTTVLFWNLNTHESCGACARRAV
jgi:hypothetical protein